ncbi:putative cell cycle control protein (Cwf22) [Aspergillus clavatus NRRL 1]|uniref:Pre-mRNA-splicing factor CWC22 n=1 Tax=Aspergillus clavatus (strain ATCC 1007 / CBS 513.65 / DSM 816 / NCTC 3887 / NRRL 1 / QM 1276 / 107) TaxID=344612 RepID=A1CRZ5_ASPCL|nr:cell cycle control protein (Cwf22), putative [Aspergillus clavatus NRRL 1]EAW08416.1 cell cycle control protein (Cwf22), putative [Aspergillus clavatus NRRL 1]
MTDSAVLQSAVRVPTPPPGISYSPQPSASRKRSPPSRSPSPNRRRSPPGDSLKEDEGAPRIDPERAVERERQLAERLRQHEKQEAARKPMTEEEKQAAAKAEYEKLLNMRSGGTYIPPARLRALQAQITDKTSKEYQRMAWEALKKSINGLINKVNVSNIKFIVPELFGENLVRGRGLFCRSIMKAQAASLPFTPIYAAMAAIVNTKLPQVGELLLNRLIVQFRKAFKRNDKAVCISSTTFIAHLCNQQVAHEMLAAQILLLLLHKPTDDSVEIAVGLTREVGQHLEEMSGPIALAVFDQFRNILHEADIDKRVQYMIEVLFQVRKDRYKDNPAVKEELDLVEEEDQITHRIGLDDEIETQDGLNVFKFDPQWEEHEEAYKKLKAEILGEGSDDEEDEDETDESSDEEEAEERQMEIKDQSNTDLVNLRRTIYLTIMSSIDFEECCHKLMKISLPPGLEPELPSMIIECCSQERTYSKFYGLIGERFAKINRMWSDLFEAAFAKYYDTIHRFETNRLRNIARFFGHMLSTDAIGWHVLSIVHLNEDETTSSSRIFIKILFQDLGEHLGLPKLKERMRDEILRPSFEGLFPLDNPRHTRFSINYFTSIGFGVLTEDMREHLQNLPKPTVPALPARAAESDSESVSSHSTCSTCTGSRSRSYSRSPSRSRGRARSVSRGRSYSRSVSGSSRGRSYTPSYSSWSRSPVSKSRRRSISYSRSRSPPGRRRSSVSRTPPRRVRDKSSDSRSPSRSVTPPRRRGSHSRRDRSYSRSPSRSVTPPPRTQAKGARGKRYSSQSLSPPRRRVERGISASRSPPRRPPPGRRPRDDSISRSPSPRPARRRRNSSSVSASPPPARGYNKRRSPSRTPPRRGRASDYL